MKAIIFGVMLLSLCLSCKEEEAKTIPFQKEVDKPVVAVLGMFHFVSKNNTVSQKFTEISSKRRQQEIKELVAALKKIKPTKIAVERPYRTQEALQEAYTGYLQGTYQLTAEETDQIAFRLGKELQHSQLYLVHAPVAYAFEEAVAFANENEQSHIIDSIVANAETLAATYDSIAYNKTIQDAVHYLNSDGAIAANHFGYYLLQQVGSKENDIGARAVGDWYTSNIKIFENIRELATKPDDRILVLYGQGHCKYLNDLIDASPELERQSITTYLE